MKWNVFSASDFDRWQEALTTLNTAGAATPLLSPAFVRPLLTFFGTGDELAAICEGPHGPLALALLARQGIGTWASFPPSAPNGIFLHAPGLELDALLPGLLDALPGFSIAIGIARQDPHLQPRPGDGAHLATGDCGRTARIELAPSFQEYWTGLPQDLRLRIESLKKRLAEDGIKARLEVLTEARQVEQAVVDYGQLESSGPRSRADAAIHPNSTKGWFYREMLEEFCRQGSGRIHCYRFNEKIVAMDLCIQSNDRLLVLKSACDDKLHHLVPALLLREQVLRSVHDEGKLSAIEIHDPPAALHGGWHAELRNLYRVDCYRWQWLARIRRSHKPSEADAIDGETCGAVYGATREQPLAVHVTRHIDDRATPGTLRRTIANLRRKLLTFTRTIRELGGLNGAAYALDRLLRAASGGRARLHKYYLTAQPVPGKRWLPHKRGTDIAVRRIAENDPVIREFPRPAHAIPYRFRQDAVCLCAWKDGKWIGFLWLTLGPYQEDEVRCRYVPLPAGAAAWDFDVYLEPAQRNGIAFLKLWDEANSFLTAHDIKWSLSRISAFNPVSLYSHARMGARRIGAAAFLSIGALQITVATVRPFLHASFGPGSFPEFTLDPGAQRRNGPAP